MLLKTVPWDYLKLCLLYYFFPAKILGKKYEKIWHDAHALTSSIGSASGSCFLWKLFRTVSSFSLVTSLASALPPGGFCEEAISLLDIYLKCTDGVLTFLMCWRKLWMVGENCCKIVTSLCIFVMKYHILTWNIVLRIVLVIRERCIDFVFNFISIAMRAMMAPF